MLGARSYTNHPSTSMTEASLAEQASLWRPEHAISTTHARLPVRASSCKKLCAQLYLISSNRSRGLCWCRMAAAPHDPAASAITLHSRGNGGHLDVKAELCVPQQLPMATIIHSVIVKSVCCSSSDVPTVAHPLDADSLEVGPGECLASLAWSKVCFPTAALTSR